MKIVDGFLILATLFALWLAHAADQAKEENGRLHYRIEILRELCIDSSVIECKFFTSIIRNEIK
jgi:hypothetical protein